MAINSARKREAALLLGGALIPDLSVDLADRATLLGQYGGFLISDVVVREYPVRLYIHQRRVVATGDINEAEGMKVQRSLSVDLYVERSRATSLNIT